MIQEKLYSNSPFIFLEKINVRRWQPLFSLLSLIVLLVISNFHAYDNLIKNKSQFAFYQTHFSPAVMYACGHPFLNPQPSTALQDFLESKTDTISCTKINAQQLKPLSAFQSAEYYLIFSAGILWKIFGIGWANLIPLFLILYSASVAATYCIFRLAMRNSIALLLTYIIATSPMQMGILLLLRDYSAAPFLLWTIWISAKLVIDNPSLKTRFMLCAAAGFITGYGLGFRTDLLIIIPYFMILLFFFAEKQVSFFQGKIIPSLIFIICFLPGGYFILHKASQFGSNLSHVMILGLSHEFSYYLSLQEPKIYSIIPAYNDIHAFNIIQSFAERVYGVNELTGFPSKQYDLYGNLFLLNYIYYLPADFLIRIYASIYQILILPFQNNPGMVYGLLKKTAVLLPLFSIVFLAFYRFRLALCTLFAVIYLCSYPVIQFGPRHYFYLDFIGLLFAGFVSEQLIAFFYKKNKSVVIQQMYLLIQTRWKTVLIASVLLTITGYGSLYLARIYQSNKLTQSFNHYLNLPETPLERTPIDEEAIRIQLPPKKVHDPLLMSLETYFLKITTENCPLPEIVLKLNYLQEPKIVMPHEIKIPGKNGVYFVPLYNFYNPGPTVINIFTLPSSFVGSMQLSSIENACLKNFSMVETDHSTPLLLNTQLVTGWEKNKLYQEFL